jgi:hypothetical protein
MLAENSRSKVDRASEDPLEPIRETTIGNPVVGKAELFENLRAGLKLDDPTSLAHGLSRRPDCHESVLAEWKSILGVTVDLEEKPAIATTLDQGSSRWSFQRHSTEHERTSAVDEVLPILGALLPHELDDLDLLQRLFGARDLQPAGFGKLAKRRADVFHPASSWLICGGRARLEAPGLFLMHEPKDGKFVTRDRGDVFYAPDVRVRLAKDSGLMTEAIHPAEVTRKQNEREQ